MAYGAVKTPDAAAQQAGISAAQAGENSNGDAVQASPGSDADEQNTTFWSRTQAFYQNNIGLFFVFLAQIFASIMAMTTRLLETGFDTKFHALQIIFVRMIVTAGIGSAYMWYKKVPGFPLGPPGVRGLLVLRGAAGTIGLFGLYCKLPAGPLKTPSRMLTVNYFAVAATVLSCAVLLVHPDIGFQTPRSTAQWLLLLSIGLSGFLLQVLLTEGLQRERAGRATNMIYTQLVTALIIEKVVWGTTPPLESFIGSLLIVGAAIWVGVQRKMPAVEKKPAQADEETGLLRAEE
ncbi:hypothetical protein LLEC1_05574 [Akanthomyces lecanii]|uniref:EamA domain-containing protein n=1 Tax=Cordyceps confragosa TaxID=2714763 RepID=A0A179IAQ6_CORDF|nr:hypothetical protein LLEC1_05574 [Akanthomyces lecanii]